MSNAAIERSGVVEAVHGPPGQDVDEGEELLTLRIARQVSQGS